jgi:transposase
MARGPAQPNPENASIADLQAAIRAGSYETQRRLTALLMLLTGSDRAQVCRAQMVGERAVRKWVAAFNERGIDGLIVAKRSGRPRAIPADKTAQLTHDLETPQVADRTFWTKRAFHGYLRDHYEIDCSYPTVCRFVQDNGYVLKVPRPWPDRQDEQRRQAFRDQLKTLLADPDVDVWYTDETGVEGEPRPRRRLAKKGSKPRVVKNGDHIRLSILGLVCPRTGEFFAIEASHTDTVVFQAFLDEIARCVRPTRPRNILILDNASWHLAKNLNWHFFEPLYLPPYSPDLNAIETLWLLLKARWFNNIHCKTVETLIEHTDRALLDLFDNPQQVAHSTRSFGTDF